MAANKFASMLHKNTNKFTLILVYVFLEWILILLLLLNSLYSYLIIKFVDYFGLKRPCIWCSRLDHVFEPQKYKNLHRDLVCENHATEISKLGYCSDHRKLAEVDDMCEDCSQSNGLETTNFGILRWVKRNEITCEVGLNCSCCDASLNNKFYSPCVLIKPSSEVSRKEKLVDEEAVNAAFVDESVHMNPTQLDRCIDDNNDTIHDRIEKGDDIEVTKNQIEFEAGERHLLATELIKHSYSDETTIQFSTEYAMSQILHQADLSLSGKILALMNRESQIAYSDFDFEEKNTMGSELYLEKEVIELDGNEDDESKFAMMVTMELEENEDYLIFHATREDIVMEVDEQGNAQSNQTGFKVYDDVQATMEDLAIDLHEQVAIAQATEAASEVEVTIKDLVIETHEQAASTYAAETESSVEDLVQAIMEDLVREVQVQDVITHATKTACEVEDDAQSTSGDLVNETSEQVAITQTTETESADENDAHGMAEDLIMEVHQAVNTETTRTTVQTKSTVHKGTNQPEEEILLLHKPISVTINERAMHMNSTLCFELDEFEEDKFPSTPTSIDDLRNLHKYIDSFDGSVISEFENGEVVSTVEKLQSALKAERKVLNALYVELEEERSASAIAASQTMAMINRLQEEKSAMQMESIQYQRMMEEQSEYDQEALQLLNELMVKREKEKHELEKELEISRKRIMEYEMKEKIAMMKRIRDSNSSIASFSNAEDSDEQSFDLNHDSAHENGSLGFQTTNVDEILHFDESLAQFEEERLSILDQLKVLEAKLFTLDEEEDGNKFIDVSSYEQFIVENSENTASFIDHDNQHQQQEKRKIIPLKPKVLLPLFDSVSGETEDEDTTMTTNGFEESVHSRNSLSSTKSESESNKYAIEEEVDHVYERLHALEADREFLRHCIGSLKKGDRGIDLLQEILLHLRDLRNVDLRAKNIGDSGSQ